MVSVGAVKTGLDERRLGIQGVVVGYHGEIAFGLIKHVTQLGEVEDPTLAQLRVKIVVGQSTHS